MNTDVSKRTAISRHIAARERLQAAWNAGERTADFVHAVQEWTAAHTAARVGEAYDAQEAAQDASEIFFACGLYGLGKRISVAHIAPLVVDGLSNMTYADTVCLPMEVVDRLGGSDDARLLCALIGCVATRQHETVGFACAYWRATRLTGEAGSGIDRNMGDTVGTLAMLEATVERDMARMARDLGLASEE